jgi:hypothetical protein
VLMTNENEIWKHIRAAMDGLDEPAGSLENQGGNLEMALADVIGLARSISVTAEEMLRAVSEKGITTPAEYSGAFLSAPDVLEATRQALMTLLSTMQVS